MTHRVEHHGCSLSYSLSGKGPPVLLIQGVGVHGAGWLPQVDALAPSYECLCFDNRGIGESQPVGAPVSVEQLAGDALALLDAVEWSTAHVVGHSLGGLVALHLGLSAPERVRSLSVLCSFARGRDAAPLSPRMLWLGLRTRVGTRRMRRRGFLRLVLPRGALAGTDQDAVADRLAELFGHDLGDQPPTSAAQLRALRAYDVTPRLGELGAIPTLVVSAERDPIAPPRLGRALAAGIPGAKYREIPGASHGAPIQRAVLLNYLLREHIGQTERTRDLPSAEPRDSLPAAAGW